MEKNRSIATMRILGGHPGLDLANTVDCRHGRFGPDLLVTFEDLAEWLQRVGLLGAAAAGRLRRWAAGEPDRADAALARVKRLREAIYRVFSALAAGAEPPPPELSLIEEEARAAQSRRRLERLAGAGYAWTWPEGDADVLAGRLAHEAADLLTTAPPGRVKECFGRNCGWLFLDSSRNNSRRWCSEEGCGTRARVARYRARSERNRPGAA